MTEPINLSGKCLLSSLNKGAECYFLTDFYTTGYLFLSQRSRPLQAISKNAGLRLFNSLSDLVASHALHHILQYYLIFFPVRPHLKNNHTVINRL